MLDLTRPPPTQAKSLPQSLLHNFISRATLNAPSMPALRLPSLALTLASIAFSRVIARVSNTKPAGAKRVDPAQPGRLLPDPLVAELANRQPRHLNRSERATLAGRGDGHRQGRARGVPTPHLASCDLATRSSQLEGQRSQPPEPKHDRQGSASIAENSKTPATAGSKRFHGTELKAFHIRKVNSFRRSSTRSRWKHVGKATRRRSLTAGTKGLASARLNGPTSMDNVERRALAM
ncbi:uncharacterized protein SCHCODRAFT_02588730 [Schizophyllum commune H4-8]|nr:uncharacterized protein SCHCODRAFT_02588730 [Schizophyllum commune H4-8]KAI5887473.1 hypothetical protein SCHCODRAFT_02588730 [Schizophyllum commune H4-8]